MVKVMGQMALTTEEKMRVAKQYNAFAQRLKLKFRISLIPSAKHTPSEVVHDKGKGPLGS